MSQVFSTPPSGDGSQRLSAEEANALIRGHQKSEAAVGANVTVQDMAEILGLPVWQVEQMLKDLRNRPPMADTPLSNSAWLKTQLWKWALLAVLAISFFPACGGITDTFSKRMNSLFGSGKSGINRTQTDGIYPHDVAEKGRQLGMTCIPGFSYRIKYDTLDAAANGDSKHYIDMDELSPQNLAIIQEQYADAILGGFSKAVEKEPPQWVNGQAVSTVKPNLYDAGLADSFDFTLNQAGFPYDPKFDASKTDPKTLAEKEMHDKMLQDIKDHWDDITD